ncbi:RPC19 [Candida oxycetoniae]|uniref:RPC19 n=1 Tax=Candida oxycetoniae TaxID=497107 RepID=A0AAI9SXD3_9ASCO|nr:RPC19 [Candida oxycetoniae]KAI3404828.2 RPC19 [Candida oxycetoniae]
MSAEEAIKIEEDHQEKEESVYDPDKIKILPGASEDGTSASFQILDEDHTLGNALRYMIMKNPEVEFCGYSIPHPSENKLNVRIQTYGNISAVEALHQGLDNLTELCDVVEEKFEEKLREAEQDSGAASAVGQSEIMEFSKEEM